MKNWLIKTKLKKIENDWLIKTKMNKFENDWLIKTKLNDLKTSEIQRRIESSDPREEKGLGEVRAHKEDLAKDHAMTQPSGTGLMTPCPSFVDAEKSECDPERHAAEERSVWDVRIILMKRFCG